MSTSSYQAFPITKYQTGLFNYLKPWISPEDSFRDLINTYIYRGNLNKREGYSVFGRISYRDNNIALGNGGKTYSGTLSVHPIVIGSFNPSDGIESFLDNGNGTLTGSSGGTGTINYTTGAWTLSFNANVSSNTNIFVIYSPNVSRPIMGIKQWQSELDGSQVLIVFDTRRASVYNQSTEIFTPLDAINQIIWVGDNTSTTVPVGTGWTSVAPYTNAIAPFSVSITDGTSTITDDGSGNLSASGNFASGGTVNYATGGIVLKFTSATTATISMTARLSGDYFNGTFTNFFNSTNWIAPAYYPSDSEGVLYCTNNVDPITLFDGTALSRPPFPITLANYVAFVNDIDHCLDVDIYKNRLLVQLPTLSGNSIPSGQSIRWSAINSPTNLAADVSGNGGELSATTDDLIKSSEFLRDQLIVLFQNSTWTFRFTGSDFAPFRFDKINDTKSTSAPYATIPYDERITAMGAKGLIACDGVNVQRYDVDIIDQFLDINQNRFAQCYGLRFDTANQTWMLYPSKLTGSTVSDRALIYNFLENTWSVYDIALSCLGLHYVSKDKTWAEMDLAWQDADFSWDNFLLQDLAPNLLGGSHTGGFIYQMYDGVTDNGATITSQVSSTRWNPFINAGTKVQFGYIDFYYTINANTIISIDFFADNTLAPSTETRTLTLDGPINSDTYSKRIYVNIVGQFLQMKMNCETDSSFQILGMILWSRPGGRFTPGLTVT